ncbi:MAG: ABC transporter ATP-binding protein [[Eubacterium] rectale]|nr:ABC transporter ATP-binding protein [Agathobacter rectalis]
MFEIFKSEIVRNKSLVGKYVLIVLLLWTVNIITPYISGQYINFLVDTTDAGTTIILFVAVIACINLLQLIIKYIQSLVLTRLNYKISYQISNDLFQKIFSSEYKYYSNVDTAYLIDQISKDSNAVVNFSTSNVVNFFLQSATLIASAIFVFRADKLLCAIILSLIPFYVLTFFLNKSKIYATKMEMKRSSNAYFSRYAEQIQKIPYVKRNELGHEMNHRLSESLNELVEASLHSVRVEYLFANLNQLIIILAYLCIIEIGGYKVRIGKLSIGYFSTINTYFNMIISSVSYFVGLAGSYQDTKASFDRINDIMSKEDERNGNILIDALKSIEIADLSIGYGNKKVLNHCFCQFERGTLYGLCGQNGKGKTTLLNAIVGLLAGDSSGDVCYNGVSISNLNMQLMRRRNISYVEQDPVLMNMSVKEYLQLGLDMNHEMQQRQKQLIKSWNLSYLMDKQMNENGSNFSGGEKQKLSLIRALSKESSLILLDEPTAALDTESIARLMNCLQKRKKDSVIIMVSHDPDVLAQCDTVLDICSIQNSNPD